jgi:hypothetical protein
MKTFKTIIKEALKEYEDTQISIVTIERGWDGRLKDWVDTKVKHTGYYRGIIFRNDGLRIKLKDNDGKMNTYPINMSSEFELPTL